MYTYIQQAVWNYVLQNSSKCEIWTFKHTHTYIHTNIHVYIQQATRTMLTAAPINARYGLLYIYIHTNIHVYIQQATRTMLTAATVNARSSRDGYAAEGPPPAKISVYQMYAGMEKESQLLH